MICSQARVLVSAKLVKESAKHHIHSAVYSVELDCILCPTWVVCWFKRSVAVLPYAKISSQ